MTGTAVSKIMSNLTNVKFNPAGIQRVALDVLEEYLSGEAEIVDPTNPFVFLLEASAVNTAFAINENIINLRKQYPALAQTEDELYLHMSDKDYIGRFATPGYANFTFMVSYEDVKNKMEYDNTEDCYKALFPRNTEVKINGVTFSLSYPIVFRKYDNGVIQISYDSEIRDPVENISSSIINYHTHRDSNGLVWILFNTPLKQFNINSTQHTVQQTAIFQEEIEYTDDFYYCRVFNRSSGTSNQWKEIKTTHTDQVFDPFVPTATLKVYSNKVRVMIPLIYITNGLVDGEIRVDIYQTQGDIDVNLGNNKISNFETVLKAVDEERDISVYSNAIKNITYAVFSTANVTNGSDDITFTELRTRVINNSSGDRSIPITNNQITSYVENRGFDLIPNIDVVTNRLFLATKRLPKPNNTKLLTAANIGIGTIITNIEYLTSLSTVVANTSSVTMLSNNLYENVNGVIKIVPPSDVIAISGLPNSSKVNTLNSRKFLYSPFYYVLDSSDLEFEVRTYHLDQPKTGFTSFINQNETLQLAVNTAYHQLYKTPNGYKLKIVTLSEEFYKTTDDSLVGCQLGIKPVGESLYAFNNGVLIGRTEDNERIFEFDIDTNYEIDSNNNITVTNFKMFNTSSVNIKCLLAGEFKIFHVTSSVTARYTPDETDLLVAKFLLPVGSVGNTHEEIQYTLGYHLKALWVRSRSYAAGNVYETYTNDVPLVYEKDVYEIDPVTGSIFSFDSGNNLIYNITHHQNDPVLNSSGNPLYKHRIGDVKLDNSGNPIIHTGLRTDREIDMFLVDGKYYFANDDSFVSYKKELANIVATWVTEDLYNLQDVLLEKTKLFFYPKSSISTVPVTADGSEDINIDSEQYVTVDIYVKSNIYRDTDIRNLITDGVIKIVDTYIEMLTVNVSEITAALRKSFIDVTEAIRVSGIGDNQYQIVKIKNMYQRLSLRKNIISQTDGKLYIKEAVIVNFINTEKL